MLIDLSARLLAVEEFEVTDRNLRVEKSRILAGVGGDRDGDARLQGGRYAVHDCFLDEDRARAVIDSASTVKVMMRAPVQARACQSL